MLCQTVVPLYPLWDRCVPCVHRHIFAVPVIRDFALWLGCVDVSKENITWILETRSIYLAPGGCREMILDPEEPIQSHHEGFLRIAYEKKCLVFPIIHTGQEDIFISWTSPWLDGIRHAILDMYGYPFPTFFSPPLPSKLTSHVLMPHDPNDYDSAEKFIEIYYTTIKNKYRAIQERNNDMRLVCKSDRLALTLNV